MKGVKSESLKDRLNRFSKANKNGCVEWIGHIEQTGYASLRFNGKRLKAHRAAWIANYGEVKDGLFVLHKCDNKKCINPDHLFLGTQYDNISDMRGKCRDRFVGQQNGRAKLSADDVLAIREALNNGVSRAALARQYKVSWDTVNGIALGKKWKHLPDRKTSITKGHAKKLTKADVKFIREWHKMRKMTRKDIAEMFDVSMSNIDQITANKIWIDA